MNDSQLFANLARLTAGTFTLEEIERLTGGVTFAERTAGNGIAYAVRVDGQSYSLERTTPPIERPGRFTISDPDLCRMAEGEDRLRDYAEDHAARLSAISGYSRF